MVKLNKSSLPEEEGVVIGTVNKYEMRNPVGRLLIDNFDKTIADLASTIKPTTILEVGCGEGHLTKILLDVTDASIQCTDLSEAIFNKPKEAHYFNRVSFQKKSIYELEPKADKANLVVCCEVLEHLEEPNLGLEKLACVAAPYCLLSVPREPMFRTLNFIRGSYFTQLGNSPGHIQHWSKRGFIKLVETKFELQQVRSPLPWTVILGKVR
jgi:2-polyprenyl-3-methyl-5-hydroxy-6-metoxy-1,4-benzoquinol methylase